MTDERLIEEARRPMTDLDITQDPAATRAFIRRLADALEAAEKAHTPTTPTDDDDREALAQVIFDRSHTPDDALTLWDGDINKLADAILAAGFRRSERSQEDRREAARALRDIGAEVPEPSADRCEQCRWAAGFGAREPIGPHTCGIAVIHREMYASTEPQGEPTDARHAEHVTVESAYKSNCLEGECDHRDEDGEPEGMSVCPKVPPFEVRVGCMEDEGRGDDPDHWDDVPLMPWPCPVALRTARGVR